MSEDTVVRFQNPGSVRNALTELRKGAGQLPAAMARAGIVRRRDRILGRLIEL